MTNIHSFSASYSEAREKFLAAARIAGAADEASIQVRRGELLLELGRAAEAEQAFEAALKSDPANAQACALRGPAGESVCDDSQHKRFADLHFWHTPQANCASQPRCVPYATWAKDYARIVAGR